MGSDVQELFAHIPSSWGCMKLSDCTIDGNISYGIVQPGQHVENGIPIIRVNNVNNGQLQLTDVLRVSPEIEDKYKRTRLEGGEVLLTLVGSTGQSFVAPKELAGWNVPRAIAVIRPKDEIGANWINICLQSKPVQHFLDVRANTTVQKTLNLKDVRDIPIPIPPEPVKEQIESIAVNLQGKIELNRQTNQTLEQIAQAIFKSWFVDFDPVRAKIAAREAFIQQHPEVTEEAICAAAGTEGDTLAHAGAKACELAAICAISGKTEEQLNELDAETLQQLKVTAGLFPDALMESELGQLPEGWSIKQVGDISESFDYVANGSFKSLSENVTLYDEPNDVLYVRTTDFNGAFSKSLKYTDKNSYEFLKKSKLFGREVIISNVGDVGTVFRAPSWMGMLMTLGSNAIAIQNNSCNGYLFWLFRSEFGQHLIQSIVTGSAQLKFNKTNFRSLHILWPSELAVNAFEVLEENLSNSINNNQKEIRLLSEVRDNLLQKLLSGEISIQTNKEELEQAI